MELYIISKYDKWNKEQVLGYCYTTYADAQKECKRLSEKANDMFKYYITKVEVKK